MNEIFDLISNDMLHSIKEVVSKNSKILEKRDGNQNTPLIFAVFHKKWDIANYFLSLNISPNVSNEKGETALMYAARYGNLDCVQKLHQIGADLNLSSLYVGPPIFYAFEYTKKDILRYLVVNGANINKKNKYGASLLVKSVENNELELLFWLINNGAKEIELALRTAILFDNFEAVQLLVSLGADINITNKNKETLIVDAINNKNWDIVELLYEKKLKLSLKIKVMAGKY